MDDFASYGHKIVHLFQKFVVTKGAPLGNGSGSGWHPNFSGLKRDCEGNRLLWPSNSSPDIRACFNTMYKTTQESGWCRVRDPKPYNA